MQGDETTSLWLDRPGDHRVACHRVDGSTPGVLFLGGYASDMTGTKATHLDTWCRETGRACARFDYLGHGASSGAFADGTIGRWADDALAVLDRVTEGPQILVGSSMGGWIMLILALARPGRVAGLVGVAAAPDFSQDIWTGMDPATRSRVMKEGAVELEEEGGTYTVTRAFVEDGRRHLMLRGPIGYDGPVRLLHGQRDTSVPWQVSTRIADRLAGDDVVVTLIKDGDHRLSRPHDLDRLTAAIEDISDR